MKLVKIVRDKIPSLVGDEGTDGAVVYRVVSREEVGLGLRKKLVEEVAEYLVDPSVGELADVLEVAYALARWDLQVELWELDAARNRKLAGRGGFRDGIGMFVS